MGLWGKKHDLDFWTAAERGEVSAVEIRAVNLMKRLCDPWRFGIYCQTGEVLCIGNFTRTLYLVRKRELVVELDDNGDVVAKCCIDIGRHGGVPDTDRVVGLKCFIEGNELVFREKGNWMPMFDSGIKRSPWVAAFNLFPSLWGDSDRYKSDEPDIVNASWPHAAMKKAEEMDRIRARGERPPRPKNMMFEPLDQRIEMAVQNELGNYQNG